MSDVVFVRCARVCFCLLLAGLIIWCVGLSTALAQQQMSHRLNGTLLTFESPMETGSRNFNLVVNTALTIQTPVDVVDITVGNPDVVSVAVHSSKQVVISGLAMGSTNISFFDHFGSPVAQYNIDVTPDLRNLQAYLDRMILGGKITVDYVNGAIVLTGQLDSVADVKRAEDLASLFSESRIFNDISVTSNNQVALKVRIVELSRTVIKRLGIQLTSFSKVNVTPNNPATLDYVARGTLDGASFAAQVDALESAGYVKTLADTVVTALSGETGSVHSGGQLRIPTGTGEEESHEYKDYGVMVDITPTVIGPGLINLNISAETSSVDTSSELAGSLFTRKTNTTIELGSGSTMMIAGLIQQEQSDSHSGTPVLKDLPIVGQLFRQRSYSDAQKELVVLVTPYLIKGARDNAFSTPIDNVIPADDISSIGFGSLNKSYERLPETPRVGRVDGYGFMND